MTRERPAWLLAVVLAIAVAGVVVLEALGHSDGAQRVIGLVVPVLAALYVTNRLDTRSDAQDEKLEEHTETLATVATSVNGDLTRRLNEAVQPIHAQLADLHAVVLRNHPDDPLVAGVTEPTTEQPQGA